ncbi:hypothetical protein [Paenibacillus guangzhouensis]|uniref:hypothetical protein n=1 Tax=Paenibacillus guangzhouensis TaxID=1473112 RepID=UPI001266B8C4|nr:hypothetical protein [Paenibacillus guangzhouensis]
MPQNPIPSTTQMAPKSISSTQRNNQLAFFSAILLLISGIIGVYLAYQDLIGNANVAVIP